MVAVLVGITLSCYFFFSHLNTTPLAFSKLDVKLDSAKTVIESYPLNAKVQTAKTIPVSPKTKSLNRTEHLFFHYHSKFLVWMFMFSVLMGTSFGFTIPLLGYLLKLKENLGWGKLKIVGVAFLALLLLFLAVSFASGLWIPSVSKSGAPLYLSFVNLMREFEILLINPQSVILKLISFSSIASLLALMGILLVNFSISKLSNIKDSAKQAYQFRELQNQLNFFLFAIAIIISGTTVTTIFGRETLMQALPGAEKLLLPIEFVYIYGGVFTVFIALIYIPIHFQLKRQGILILEKLETKELKKKKEGDSLSKDFSTWKDIFKMKASNFDTAKIILSILGPLLTSLIGKLAEF